MRTAVVTGASAGIGLATASRLVDDGYRVVITGRDEGRLREAARTIGDSEYLTCLELDARDHVATAEQLARVQPDVLVANVGMGYAGNVHDTPLKDWHTVLDTNVTSAFVAVQAVVPTMVERGWGRIVTVGSLASHRPIRFGVAYTASKHALWGLTRAVALDLRGTGVTANLVAPAFVRTGMTRANAEIISAAGTRSVDEVQEKLGLLSDLGRLLEPEEVADEIASYLGDDRSGQISVMGDIVDG